MSNVFSVNDTDNQTQLVNGTKECIESVVCTEDSFKSWYILILFMIFGVFLFCSALCCAVWVDEDEANSKADLILISGYGKEVLQKVPLHAIRLEDFVYLLPPSNDSSSSSSIRSSEYQKKRKPTQSCLFGKTDFSLSKGTLEKKNIEAEKTAYFVKQNVKPKSLKSELSISTSVNRIYPKRNVNSPKIYFRKQVSSTKLKVAGNSTTKTKQKTTQKKAPI